MVLSDAVTAAFDRRPITPCKIYQPDWDVGEDESMYADIPENGIIAYRILKGMQLPLDRPVGSLMTPAARLAHDQLVVGFIHHSLHFFFCFLTSPLSFAGQ